MMYGRMISVADHSGNNDEGNNCQFVLTCERPVGEPEGEVRYTLNARFYRLCPESEKDVMIPIFGSVLKKMAIIMDAIQLVWLMNNPDAAKALAIRLESKISELQSEMANALSEELGFDVKTALTKLFDSVAQTDDSG
ncbi:MAG: hypothetical protein NTY30_02985 [Candidatus Berkelbacteria bacterium]|nr:hypothetical protein [Candidatus Berkelbacteria bacterium]